VNENLKQKIIESQASISEIAALLEKDFSTEGVLGFFKGKGVELSVGEAEDFLSLMQGARDSVVATKLSDDELVGVAGGVEQGIGGDADIVDTVRYLACKAAPFLAGCHRIIQLYESRGY